METEHFGDLREAEVRATEQINRHGETMSAADVHRCLAGPFSKGAAERVGMQTTPSRIHGHSGHVFIPSRSSTRIRRDSHAGKSLPRRFRGCREKGFHLLCHRKWRVRDPAPHQGGRRGPGINPSPCNLSISRTIIIRHARAAPSPHSHGNENCRKSPLNCRKSSMTTFEPCVTLLHSAPNVLSVQTPKIQNSQPP